MIIRRNVTGSVVEEFHEGKVEAQLRADALAALHPGHNPNVYSSVNHNWMADGDSYWVVYYNLVPGVRA